MLLLFLILGSENLAALGVLLKDIYMLSPPIYACDLDAVVFLSVAMPRELVEL